MNGILVASIILLGASTYYFAVAAFHQREELAVCIQLLDPEVNAVLVEPN